MPLLPRATALALMIALCWLPGIRPAATAAPTDGAHELAADVHGATLVAVCEVTPPLVAPVPASKLSSTVAPGSAANAIARPAANWIHHRTAGRANASAQRLVGTVELRL